MVPVIYLKGNTGFRKFRCLKQCRHLLKYKFVILFFQLCAEGIIDQNVAGTDDSTDTAPEIFGADRQMNSCSTFQIRTFFSSVGLI